MIHQESDLRQVEILLTAVLILTCLIVLAAWMPVLYWRLSGF
jgi:hypothetical protein